MFRNNEYILYKEHVVYNNINIYKTKIMFGSKPLAKVAMFFKLNF